MENNQIPERTYSAEGVDHLPIPTMRSVSPDFIPCVLATLRDIVHDYISSEHPQRNRIWHRLLSAMKLSLSTIRRADKGSKRKRPFRQQAEVHERDEAKAQDVRAIKKATRLVLEGCATKGARVMGQNFTSLDLTDEEILDKLAQLHPPTALRLHSP